MNACLAVFIFIWYWRCLYIYIYMISQKWVSLWTANVQFASTLWRHINVAATWGRHWVMTSHQYRNNVRSIMSQQREVENIDLSLLRHCRPYDVTLMSQQWREVDNVAEREEYVDLTLLSRILSTSRCCDKVVTTKLWRILDLLLDIFISFFSYRMMHYYRFQLSLPEHMNWCS